jgi:mRNA-degrading endonuclease RelE of RelBE toxin-antitoxin system
MDSRTTRQFRQQYRRLPLEIRQQAYKAYRLWQENPYHASLQFKRISVREPIYSVRIGLHWRALALLEENTATWWWIGSHAEYDDLLKSA